MFQQSASAFVKWCCFDSFWSLCVTHMSRVWFHSRSYMQSSVCCSASEATVWMYSSWFVTHSSVCNDVKLYSRVVSNWISTDSEHVVVIRDIDFLDPCTTPIGPSDSKHPRRTAGRCRRRAALPRRAWPITSHRTPRAIHPSGNSRSGFSDLWCQSLIDVSPIRNEELDKAGSRVIGRIHFAVVRLRCGVLWKTVITKFKMHRTECSLISQVK